MFELQEVRIVDQLSAVDRLFPSLATFPYLCGISIHEPATIANSGLVKSEDTFAQWPVCLLFSGVEFLRQCISYKIMINETRPAVAVNISFK